MAVTTPKRISIEMRVAKGEYSGDNIAKTERNLSKVFATPQEMLAELDAVLAEMRQDLADAVLTHAEWATLNNDEVWSESNPFEIRSRFNGEVMEDASSHAEGTGDDLVQAVESEVENPDTLDISDESREALANED